MSARSTTISCSGSATGKEKRRAFSGSRGTRNRGGRLPFPAGASTRSDGPERRSIPFGIGWRVDATTLTPPETSAPLAPGEENERNRSYGGDRCGPRQGEIGRASCRARGWQSVWIWVVAVSLKKKIRPLTIYI